MASLRYYLRRIKRISDHPTIQLIAILSLIFLLFRWIFAHNHDDEKKGLGPVGLPVQRVDSWGIKWSKLYFVTHATTPEELCNAVMVWSEIEEIGSRAQRMMMYPSHWSTDEKDDSPAQEYTNIARLLRRARDLHVKLHPVEALHQNSTERSMWGDSYTKLLAFNLTQFDRVLVIDPNGVVLHNMDALFLLPKADVAMPYVYWGKSAGWDYTSHLLLLKPSAITFKKVETVVQTAATDGYDAGVLRSIFGSKMLRMPQKPYNLLSGEFRRTNHEAYLSSTSNPKTYHPSQAWDPEVAISKATYVHFSDWPFPKPWMRATQSMLNTYMPVCQKSEWFGATDCRDRTVWNKLYSDFEARRIGVCGGGFEVRVQESMPEDVYRHGKWIHPDEVAL